MRPLLFSPDTAAQVVIAGLGNCGHALTAMFGCISPDWKVRVWKTGQDGKLPRSMRSVTAEVRSRGMELTGKVQACNTDPRKILPGCDFLIITVPASHHERVLTAAKPYLKRGMVLGILVAEGGVDWCVRRCLGDELYNGIIFFSLETTPWACRILQYGKRVLICGAKEAIHYAVHPPFMVDVVGNLLSRTMTLPDHVSAIDRKFPEFLPGSFLFLTMQNPNAYVHPAIMYGRWANWDGVPVNEPPLFYEGISSQAAVIAQTISLELLQIARSLEQAIPGLDLSSLRAIDQLVLEYYGPMIRDTTDLVSMLRTSAVHRGITHPMKINNVGKYEPDFESRYLSEDLPYGLIVQKGLAEICGVPTPGMDFIITWAEKKINKRFLDIHGNLADDQVNETRAPQRFGIKTLKELEALMAESDYKSIGLHSRL